MTFYFANFEFKDPVVDEICYLPSTLMDLEHFMLIFLARRSNHDPIFWPPDDKEEKVFDFCSTLISIVYF